MTCIGPSRQGIRRRIPPPEQLERKGEVLRGGDFDDPVVDSFVPLVLAPARLLLAFGELLDQPRRVGADTRSAGSAGLRVTTKGLGRFGLPELQSFDVPAQLGGPWARRLLGL